MALSEKEKKIQENIKILSPQRVVGEKEKMSKLRMKPEHFNKTKIYIEKDSGLVKEGTASYRKLHLNGTPIVCFEGEALTAKEAACFNKEAKDYYLEAIK